MARELREPMYLVGQCPIPPGPLAGSMPPTNGEVLRKIRGQWKAVREDKPGTGSIYDAALITATDIEVWWARTGINLKTTDGIIFMIRKLHDEWSKFYKERSKKKTSAREEKENEWSEMLGRTFWPVCSKYEKKLEQSTREEMIEDRNYLQKLKVREKATIGVKDSKLEKRERRKAKGKERVVKPTIERVSGAESQSQESQESSQDEFGQEPLKPRRAPVTTVFSPAICAIADKHALSHRAVSELANQLLADRGEDIDDHASSITTAKRYRDITRKQV